VGNWNVWRLYKTEKFAQAMNKMEEYNIKLLSVSETRWTGSGVMQLTSVHNLLYSGSRDCHQSRGVGVMISRRMHCSLLE
jgi:hypothetical protein